MKNMILAAALLITSHYNITASAMDSSDDTVDSEEARDDAIRALEEDWCWQMFLSFLALYRGF